MKILKLTVVQLIKVDENIQKIVWLNLCEKWNVVRNEGSMGGKKVRVASRRVVGQKYEALVTSQSSCQSNGHACAQLQPCAVYAYIEYIWRYRCPYHPLHGGH
jgi:hypothetical protein